MVRGILALSVVCFAACGDDGSGSGLDGGNGDGPDQSVNGDGNTGVDFASPVDATCMLQTFTGFPGISAQLRRLDCSCGCVIDSFDTTQVSGFWNGSVMDSTFNPTVTGLNVTPAIGDGGVAFGGLTSINPANTFFLDGDFDVLIDYQLETALPNDAQASLQVNNLKPPVNSTYTVERQRSVGGAQLYSAAVAGIQPVTAATTATTGTLELERTGFTIRAVADGTEVTRFTGAVQDRLALLLTAGVNSCSGGGCTFTVRWRNLRMTRGALVDRQ